MQSAFATRAIDVTLRLGKGSWGNSGFDTVKLSGMRVHAELGFIMNPGATTAILHIWGITRNQLNQFTQAGLQYGVRNNIVLVEAGDVGGTMSAVFQGVVLESFPDFTAMPDVPLMISASTTADLQLKPVPPSSVKGAVDVATLMGAMAKTAGLTLENAGVDVKLSNPYFSGTIWHRSMLVRMRRTFTPSQTACMACWRSSQRTGAGPAHRRSSHPLRA